MENTGSPSNGGIQGTAPVDNSAASNTNTVETKVEGQPGVSPTPPASKKEVFKYVHNGKEIEEELDLIDKETIKKKLALARNASFTTSRAKELMQQAEKEKQELQKFMEAAKTNPKEVFKKFGYTPQQLIEALAEQEAWESLPEPAVKSLRVLENSLS